MWEHVTDYANRLWGSTLPNRLAWAICVALVCELFIWLSTRWLKRVLQPVLQRDVHLEAPERVHRRKILLGLPLRLLHGAINVIGFLIILRYLGFATGAELVPLLLGGLGVAALAGWNVLRDSVAGYFLLYDDLFGVGDRVTIGDLTGTVLAVGLRQTQLQGPDGREIALANREIRTVVNHTRHRDLPRKAQSL